MNNINLTTYSLNAFYFDVFFFSFCSCGGFNPAGPSANKHLFNLTYPKIRIKYVKICIHRSSKSKNYFT